MLMEIRFYSKFYFLILLFSFFFYSNTSISQDKLVKGFLINSNTKKLIKSNAEIINSYEGDVLDLSSDGSFNFYTNEEKLDIIIVTEKYFIKNQHIQVPQDSLLIFLDPLSVNIEEFELYSKNINLFETIKLDDLEETSIYSGKKSEVLLLDDYRIGLSVNNTRKIFSQVSGLNIYQNDDAGLQLNIGGRGLDPNRTSNFITKQNGYDISADYLGYPESYYTPPSESIQRIEIIRGAASLQYGTQFGGMINFKLKEPNRRKLIEINFRNSFGSNNLFSTFNSISICKNKFSSYQFFNYKYGNGFRDNSEFKSINFYTNLNWNFSNNEKLNFDFTYMNYIAKQPGGLTDDMFYSNIFQSNRSRNWFSVNWSLFNLKYLNTINKNHSYSISLFGLLAERNALGFRTNRVSQLDQNNERDLIKGEFNNIGIESKYVIKNKIGKKNITNLFGVKAYYSLNKSQQGPGSKYSDANFNFYNSQFPYYPNQNKYEYPNMNLAVFNENIFYITERFSITPGIRYEFINTQSVGSYKLINLDAAANPILDTTIFNENVNKRSFVLFGLGISYKFNNFELYSNISQNYRSVTFADISVVNPAYMISENISDESGYTIDLGIRDRKNNFTSYDVSIFNLLYNDRIGFTLEELEKNVVKSVRDNIGTALILGVETLIDFNLSNFFDNFYKLNYYINNSIIKSKYIHSEKSGVIGNNVEFVPLINFKTGLIFGFTDYLFDFQYTFVSKQYTDATNADIGNLSGVVGMIPKYDILDFGVKYLRKRYDVEFGINNLLNEKYFTRRATGYPGPGIIPSSVRNFYITLQYKL